MTGCGATVENLDYLLLCLLIERSIMLLGIGSSTVEIYKFILHPINRYIPSLLRFPLGMSDSFAFGKLSGQFQIVDEVFESKIIGGK